MSNVIPLPTSGELAASMLRHPAGKRFLSRSSESEGCVLCAKHGVYHDQPHQYDEVHTPLCQATADAAIDQAVQAAHIIDDQQKELARYKRANREALDLLTLALHAHDAGRTEVVNEYLERSVDGLYRAANPQVKR